MYSFLSEDKMLYNIILAIFVAVLDILRKLKLLYLEKSGRIFTKCLTCKHKLYWCTSWCYDLGLWPNFFCFRESSKAPVKVDPTGAHRAVFCWLFL